VWVSDKRIAVAASSSIDKTTVDLDRGEMAFQQFNFGSKFDDISLSDKSPFDKMLALRDMLGENCFPDYLVRYISQNCGANQRLLAVQVSFDISGYSDTEQGLDKIAIERRRGFFGTSQMQKAKYPDAIHHLRMFRNGEGRARLFYKQSGGTITFIRNVK